MREFDRPKLQAEIVERIAAGEPLQQILRDEHMPAHRETVHQWRKSDKAFDEAFLRARDDGFDAIAEETLSIVDTPPERTATENGDKVDSGHVAWLKNRAEQRLKLLAKWDPRRYGDRVTLAGDADAPLHGMTREQVDARLKELGVDPSKLPGADA